MDKKQGSDDLVKRNLDDDDTEGQKVTRTHAVPDDAPGPDDGFKFPLTDDDTEGQKVTRTHAVPENPGPDEAAKRNT